MHDFRKKNSQESNIKIRQVHFGDACVCCTEYRSLFSHYLVFRHDCFFPLNTQNAHIYPNKYTENVRISQRVLNLI